MKMKRTLTIILLMIIVLLQFNFVSAYYDIRTMDVTLKVANDTTNLDQLAPSTTFELAVHIGNFTNIEKGIRYIQAQLEYDKTILEYAGIRPQNGWELKDNSFNEVNGKFIVDSNSPVTTEGDTFKIAFRTKAGIDEDKTTSISLKGIEASGGDGLITAMDATIAIGIEVPEEPDLPESITSTKYEIANEMIAKIIPGTTVKEFMKNVTTENVDNDGIVFIDKNGNTLNENGVIGTGMKIKVGKTLQFTASVIGDVDGDTQITVNDLAKVKLHVIADDSKTEDFLTGVYLKAADVDGKLENNEAIGMNDIAKIKLVLINLEVIQ